MEIVWISIHKNVSVQCQLDVEPRAVDNMNNYTISGAPSGLFY